MDFKIAFFIFVSLFHGSLLDCQSDATVQISYNKTGTPNNLTFHCPYVSRCLYDYNPLLTDSHDIHRPCCTPCTSSSTDNCLIHCCPDIMPCTLPSATPVDQHKVCVPLTLGKRYVENGVLAIATCKQGSDENERVKCLQEYDFQTEVLDIIPVTDINSLEIYRNMHCALCNGLNSTSFKYWLVRVFCEWTSNVDLTQYSDILGANDACAISYENPYPETNVDQCDYIIDSCNVTGLVIKSNRQYQRSKRMCEKAQGPPSSYFSNENMTFKNDDCALCNGVGVASYTHSRPKFPAFSTVLNFDNRHVSGSQPTACRPGTVLFKAKNLCIEARCSLMRRLQDNACETVIPIVESFAYKIIFRIKTDANINIQTGFSWVKQVGEILEDLLQSVFSAVTDIVYAVVLVADKKEHTPQTTHEIMNARLLWFEVRAKLKNVELHDPEEKLKTLLHVSTETSFRVIINEEINFITLMLKDDNLYNNRRDHPTNHQCSEYIFGFEPCEKLKLSNITGVITPSDNFIAVPYYGYRSDKMLDVFYDEPIGMERNILEFRKCPFVGVLKKDLHWTETDVGLQFSNTGLFISFSEFVYGDNEDLVWVCVDTYQALHSSSGRVSLNLQLTPCPNSFIIVCIAFTAMLLLIDR